MNGLKGSIVALVTPMTPTGALDYAALEHLVTQHLEAQTQALVINGSTAEAITLSEAERAAVLQRVIAQVAKRIPVIAGTGSASTQDTIHRTEQALALGADAALIVTPYYNRPTQEGLYQHYAMIAAAVPFLPIILYTVPRRTGVDFTVDTLERLSEIPNIVGFKDARGDLGTQAQILERCGGRLALYSGDDETALAFIQGGGQGVISVVANVVPQIMQALCAAALSGDHTGAQLLNEALIPLYEAMSVEPNPIPIKWALAALGWIQSGIRLPLTPLSAQYQDQVRLAMNTAGVLTV